jgi:hypothetical protein
MPCGQDDVLIDEDARAECGRWLVGERLPGAQPQGGAELRGRRHERRGIGVRDEGDDRRRGERLLAR